MDDGRWTKGRRWRDKVAGAGHVPKLHFGRKVAGATKVRIWLEDRWQNALEGMKTWARVNSPWAIHFNSGGCNGCDIELLSTLTPRYDIERLGIKLQGSPRHADVLICTGPVTRQTRDRLKRIYEQMPDPKFVIAIGSCALSGGVFQESYNCLGGIDQVIPVDVYVPGCPPRPEAIIDGMVKLLEKLKDDGRRTTAERTTNDG